MLIQHSRPRKLSLRALFLKKLPPLFTTFSPALALILVSSIGFAQNKKIDLDDLMIKGELHSDDRLMILSRQKNELKNFIKFRTNYREEILEQLPAPQPKRKF